MPGSEQLRLGDPLPQQVPIRLKDFACNMQSPRHDQVYARVRCNRPANHDGFHQKIRPEDFAVLAEWDDYSYVKFPKW